MSAECLDSSDETSDFTFKPKYTLSDIKGMCRAAESDSQVPILPHIASTAASSKNSRYKGDEFHVDDDFSTSTFQSSTTSFRITNSSFNNTVVVNGAKEAARRLKQHKIDQSQEMFRIEEALKEKREKEKLASNRAEILRRKIAADLKEKRNFEERMKNLHETEKEELVRKRKERDSESARHLVAITVDRLREKKVKQKFSLEDEVKIVEERQKARDEENKRKVDALRELTEKRLHEREEKVMKEKADFIRAEKEREWKSKLEQKEKQDKIEAARKAAICRLKEIKDKRKKETERILSQSFESKFNTATTREDTVLEESMDPLIAKDIIDMTGIGSAPSAKETAKQAKQKELEARRVIAELERDPVPANFRMGNEELTRKRKIRDEAVKQMRAIRHAQQQSYGQSFHNEDVQHSTDDSMKSGGPVFGVKSLTKEHKRKLISLRV